MKRFALIIILSVIGFSVSYADTQNTYKNLMMLQVLTEAAFEKSLIEHSVQFSKNKYYQYGDLMPYMESILGTATKIENQGQTVLYFKGYEAFEFKLDHALINDIFHAYKVNSIYTFYAAKNIQMYPLTADVEYVSGNGLLMKATSPSSSSPSGLIDLQFSHLGGIVNFPLGEKASMYISGRFVYIAAILKPAMQRVWPGTIEGPLNFDLQTKISLTPDKNNTIYIAYIGGYDWHFQNITNNFINIPEFQGRFERRQYNSLVNVNYFYTGSKELQNRITLNYNHLKNNQTFSNGQATSDYTAHIVNIEEHFRYSINNQLRFYAGIGWNFRSVGSLFDITTPVTFQTNTNSFTYPYSIPSSFSNDLNTTGLSSHITAYYKNELNLRPLYLKLGIRYDFETIKNIHSFLPRVGARLRFDKRGSDVTLTYGRYANFKDSQTFHQPLASSSNVTYNETSDSVLVGSKIYFADKLYLKVEGYYNNFLNSYTYAAINSAERQALNYYSYGGEASVIYESKKMGGYFSYFNNSSKRSDTNAYMPTHSDYRFMTGFFVKPIKNLYINFEMEYNAGKRYTPVTGIASGVYNSATDDTRVFTFGTINSAKLPDDMTGLLTVEYEFTVKGITFGVGTDLRFLSIFKLPPKTVPNYKNIKDNNITDYLANFKAADTTSAANPFNIRFTVKF